MTYIGGTYITKVKFKQSSCLFYGIKIHLEMPKKSRVKIWSSYQYNSHI